MPEIKLEHVVACSSEDKNFPAQNLINGGGFKKWKGAAAGEKRISATFQLEKSSVIDHIDIGNEGSAFVEVLVGKSGMKDEDFQVILVTSSFMTPLDSRANKNTSSVRMFSRDKLSASVRDEKWDRVQVVCTQPFNKNEQYGLAFVKFHGPSDNSSKDGASKQSNFGAFKLKTDSSPNIQTGSLFARRDKEKTSTPSPLTGAAAVRAASRLAEEAQSASVTSSDPSPKQVKRKHSDDPDTSTSSKSRKSLAETDTAASTSKTKHQASDNADSSSSQRKRRLSDDTDGSSGKAKRPQTPRDETNRTPLRKQSTSVSSVSSSRSDSRRQHKDNTPLKKTHSEPGKTPKKVDFSKVMKKVVFVLSGFQNPLRGQLRDKAMEMGANYSPDWGKHCTHLICAFENTPKYSQVQGKGRIVKQTWIEDCHKAKRLLQWRKYRLGRAKSPPGGSDSSEESEDEESPRRTKHAAGKKETTRSKGRAPEEELAADEDDPYGGATDSGDDTEDEIQRVKQAAKQTPKPATTTSVKNAKQAEDDNDDIYDASTDEEMEAGPSNGKAGNLDDNDGDDSLPELPDYFKGKRFFLYGNIERKVERLLRRYIIAYNGRLEKYMSDDVSYVITEQDWDQNFEQALADNAGLSFIRPQWVFSCDEKQKLVPFQKFIVVPKD